MKPISLVKLNHGWNTPPPLRVTTTLGLLTRTTAPVRYIINILINRRTDNDVEYSVITVNAVKYNYNAELF